MQSPGGEIFHITQFDSEKETASWIASDRRRAWLKERGWERWDIVFLARQDILVMKDEQWDEVIAVNPWLSIA